MNIIKINELYQDIILEHNERPCCHYKMKNLTNYAKGFNSFCGDQIEIFANVQKNIIRNISFWSQGCAISKASASIMISLIKKKTVKEAMENFLLFHQYLTNNQSLQILEHDMRELIVFQGIKRFPVRMKCVFLPWNTMKSAMIKNN
jgi:nitrogen fixation NifU-like protein